MKLKISLALMLVLIFLASCSPSTPSKSPTFYAPTIKKAQEYSGIVLSLRRTTGRYLRDVTVIYFDSGEVLYLTGIYSLELGKYYAITVKGSSHEKFLVDMESKNGNQ